MDKDRPLGEIDSPANEIDAVSQRKKQVRLLRNARETAMSITLGAASYAVLHLCISRALPKRLSRRLPEASRSTFLLNSLLSGLAGARTIFGAEFDADLLGTYPGWLNHAFSAFGGYMLYDTALLLTKSNVERNLYIHHVAAALGIFATMTVRTASFFPAVTLFSELSLFSVYWLQVQKARPINPRSTTHMHALWYRLLSTLIFRTFVVPYAIIRATSMMRSQIAKRESKLHKQVTMGEILGLIRAKVPLWVSIGTGLNVTIFTILNLSWTIEMIQKTSSGLRSPSLQH